MERHTTNEAQGGGSRNASNLHFREQNPEDAADARDGATLDFAGLLRLSYDDELRCDPYNRTGRLTRGKR
jgi:hypothetical protein